VTLVKKSMEDGFKPGDMVVHPRHGVGKINALMNKNISGDDQQFFEIVICDSGMRIMIPVPQVRTAGLRKVVDRKAVDKVYKILKERRTRVDTQTWNRRFREYSQKINTGSVFEIAEVLRDLSVLSVDKELSFGEKKMLDTAQNRLVSEIAIAKARTREKVMGEIQAIFA
jgi:CarD family transcriptional regulator